MCGVRLTWNWRRLLISLDCLALTVTFLAVIIPTHEPRFQGVITNPPPKIWWTRDQSPRVVAIKALIAPD